MIKRTAHITFFVLCSLYSALMAQQVLAEKMVTDLSSHVIEISSQFSGTELLIFGAIERNIPQADGAQEVVVEGADYDIIVVVQSERHDLIIRRKEKIGPIWANNDFKTLKNIQGYYAMATTRPLSLILPDDKLEKLELGILHLKIEFLESTSPEDDWAYREGFIRNMQAKNLYSQREGTIRILDDILFRAILTFPANMPVGNYQVDVYLVRDGKIILSKQAPLEVGKTGLERVIYRFAHDYPPYYGILAILVALFAGLLGGFLTKKMSG